MSKITQSPPAIGFTYGRIKSTIQFFDEQVSSEEILKMLNDSSFRRAPEMIRALLPACISLQIAIRMGMKVGAETVSLFWSVEHILCNFEAGIYPLVSTDQRYSCRNGYGRSNGMEQQD